MAALPSIWSFLAAFPAVIWSLDWTRTSPGCSRISNICFVLPSFSFWPIFNSETHSHTIRKTNNNNAVDWMEVLGIVELYLVRRPSWWFLAGSGSGRETESKQAASPAVTQLWKDGRRQARLSRAACAEKGEVERNLEASSTNHVVRLVQTTNHCQDF